MRHPRYGLRVYTGLRVTAYFDLSKAGIRKCATGPELRAACTEVVVSKALPHAISISPFDPRRKTQRYRESFKVEQTHVTLPDRFPMRRVATRLVNTAPHATIVEWGDGRRVPAHHVLTRTLAHLGPLR